MLIPRCALAALLVLAGGLSAQAQQYPSVGGRYFPLDQRTPPGVAAWWTGMQGKANHGAFQPIRVELPTKGTVTVYNGSAGAPVLLPAPAQFAVGVGHIYRIRIGDMPEFPGAELYPSIEVLDRLHPPPGLAAAFPVPVHFTEEEIESALEGRMVTKVVYLEQPELAPGRAQHGPLPVTTVPSHRNLLTEADRVGRPLLVLRLGGRTPGVQEPGSAFFGSGAPVMLSTRQAPSRVR